MNNTSLPLLSQAVCNLVGLTCTAMAGTIQRVKRGVLVSIEQPGSLQSFQLFYEELPPSKRVQRIRRVRSA
jgi:hypothetical protein